MNKPFSAQPDRLSPLTIHRVESGPLPLLSQDAPFAVKPLCEEFRKDMQGSLAIYEGKRFEVTGVAIKVGPDIHNKPSIELSDCVGGETCALAVFPTDAHYRAVAVGDTVTVRANYLVFREQFGVVLKYSELVQVEKPDDRA